MRNLSGNGPATALTLGENTKTVAGGYFCIDE